MVDELCFSQKRVEYLLLFSLKMFIFGNEHIHTKTGQKSKNVENHWKYNICAPDNKRTKVDSFSQRIQCILSELPQKITLVQDMLEIFTI